MFKMSPLCVIIPHMRERLTGKVEAVLFAGDSSGVSKEVKKIQVFSNRGVKGDVHYGKTRLLDVRERQLKEFGLPKGIEIANFRQFSATSDEELKAIAEAMGISNIKYGLLGENLVISGIDNLTQLPTGTMFMFRKPEDSSIRTAVLFAWKENTPCVIPARNIQESHGEVKFTKSFQTAALGKRGLVGVVYSSGFIHQGDRVEVRLP